MMMRSKRDSLVEAVNRRLLLPIPEFALTERGEVIDRLLQQPELVDYIEATAARRSSSLEQVRKTARRYASEIGPRFSPFFYFRLGKFLAGNLVRLHFRIRAVSVNEQLANISSNATVILVSNHRSNFDPLVITYLASQRSTIALSAGEWARLWPLHHIVRAAGGFVVDRGADDPLYRQVLGSYIRMSAASGLHHAVFPEGELTRDGKMNSPKLGFLNFYCRACSGDRDIVFVPVGVNYDRIPEDRRLVGASGSFANPKASFLIGSSLRYIASVLTLPFRRRSHRYGNASVAFGAPVSLQQWLRRHNIGIEALRESGRLAWLPDLANDVMSRCASEIPATPAVLVAAVICREPDRDSWSADELKDAVLRLAAELTNRGAHAGVDGNADEWFQAALDLLAHNKLIQCVDEKYYIASQQELPVLQYYANSIGHLVA